MKEIIDRLFGKKVKIVYAYALYGYARHEQSFIFPGNVCDDDIKKVLRNRDDGRLKNFSVIFISKKRSKTLLIEDDRYRPLQESKVTKWYDD